MVAGVGLQDEYCRHAFSRPLDHVLATVPAYDTYGRHRV
jgi:hypothetical protein